VRWPTPALRSMCGKAFRPAFVAVLFDTDWLRGTGLSSASSLTLNSFLFFVLVSVSCVIERLPIITRGLVLPCVVGEFRVGEGPDGDVEGGTLEPEAEIGPS